MMASTATRIAAAALAAALLLPSQAGAQSISDKLNSWFFGSGSSTPQSGTPDNAQTDIECPGVEVRAGAATLAINAPGAASGPMNTRYQVTIAQLARECAALGGVVTMRVGVQGRVLLGPEGGPGQVDVPLRLAVVQEGPEPKPIVSKFARLTVAVPPGQTAVPFVHIEQDVTFPMPRGNLIEAYVVYVGFDPSSAKPEPRQKTKKK
jgi:hypothetical protein